MRQAECTLSSDMSILLYRATTRLHAYCIRPSSRGQASRIINAEKKIRIITVLELRTEQPSSIARDPYLPCYLYRPLQRNTTAMYEDSGTLACWLDRDISYSLSHSHTTRVGTCGLLYLVRIILIRTTPVQLYQPVVLL